VTRRRARPEAHQFDQLGQRAIHQASHAAEDDVGDDHGQRDPERHLGDAAHDLPSPRPCERHREQADREEKYLDPFFDRARNDRPGEQQADERHANRGVHRDGIGLGIAAGRECIQFL